LVLNPPPRSRALRASRSTLAIMEGQFIQGLPPSAALLLVTTARPRRRGLMLHSTLTMRMATLMLAREFPGSIDLPLLLTPAPPPSGPVKSGHLSTLFSPLQSLSWKPVLSSWAPLSSTRRSTGVLVLHPQASRIPCWLSQRRTRWWLTSRVGCVKQGGSTSLWAKPHRMSTGRDTG
jgi:hypothetical protein